MKNGIYFGIQQGKSSVYATLVDFDFEFRVNVKEFDPKVSRIVTDS